MIVLKEYTSSLVGAFGCLAAGMTAGRVFHATGNSLWYATIVKPWFNPPSWIFGLVWPVLYLMMGFAFGRLWDKKEREFGALLLFGIQFLFNLCWSPLFFYFHRIDLAFYESIFLLISVYGLLWKVQEDRVSFYLLVPYALWVSFALVLSGAIYWLNIVKA